MWHMRSEIAPAILLVTDFGSWYESGIKEPPRYIFHRCPVQPHGHTAIEDACNSTYIIHHTEPSLLKDVIIPCNHLLPRLRISQNQPRHTLLYFKEDKLMHGVHICFNLIRVCLFLFFFGALLQISLKRISNTSK